MDIRQLRAHAIKFVFFWPLNSPGNRQNWWSSVLPSIITVLIRLHNFHEQILLWLYALLLQPCCLFKSRRSPTNDQYCLASILVESLAFHRPTTNIWQTSCLHECTLTYLNKVKYLRNHQLHWKHFHWMLLFQIFNLIVYIQFAATYVAWPLNIIPKGLQVIRFLMHWLCLPNNYC